LQPRWTSSRQLMRSVGLLIAAIHPRAQQKRFKSYEHRSRCGDR